MPGRFRAVNLPEVDLVVLSSPIKNNGLLNITAAFAYLVVLSLYHMSDHQ